MIDLSKGYLEARRRTLLIELDAIEQALEMPEERRNLTLRKRPQAKAILDDDPRRVFVTDERDTPKQ